MKARILSVAMALCMIAVVFTALPTKAEVYYTGTVQTMDDDGTPKTVFFEGDFVYVNVTLFYQNVLVDADIRVQIFEDGDAYDSIITTTNDPAVGYYNSTISVPTDALPTSAITVSGDMTICDIVLSVQTPYGWAEVTREQIVLRNEGVSLDPTTYPYYPGQEVKITVTTGNTAEFYVTVWDSADHDLVPEWTYQTVDATGVWTENFTIPADADDGTYRVRVVEEGTDVVWFVAYFTIASFFVEINADRDVVLPGETVTVEYIVFDIATLDVYTTVDSEWSATWSNLTGDEQIETGELVPSYMGYELFTVPADINLSSDYQIHFWFNDTEDRSTDAIFTIAIGQMMGDVSTDYASYYAGETVSVDVEAWVEYDWDDSDLNGLPDADVDVVVDRNGDVISEYGATGLTTGYDGVAVHEFSLADTADVGTYTVTATISKLDYSIVRMTTFEVAVSLDFTVELDKGAYYSGETATARFTAEWGTETITDMSVFFVVFSEVGNLTTGNSTEGEVSFDVPSDFVGTLEIKAMTMVNGNYLWDTDEAQVYKAFVALAVTTEEYAAGDTVMWDFRILTSMTDGMLSYTILSSDWVQVASTSLEFTTAGTISYTVPAESPADWYELTVVVKDGLGNEASASATAYLVIDYTLSVWLESDSGYVGGAFEPGDEVEIGYEITTNGAPHKSVYKLWYYASWDDSEVYYSVLTTSPTGTLTVTVTDGVADGTYDVDVWLYDGLTDGYMGYDWAEVEIEASQSGWTKEIAGMSAVDFVTLVLVVVMIVLLIVVPFLKGRSGPIFKKKEPAPMTMPPEPPPAPPQ